MVGPRPLPLRLMAWGEKSVDKGLEVSVVDAADAEECAEVDRCEDPVEQVGQLELVGPVRGTIEHCLDLNAAALEVSDAVDVGAVVELARADHCT